MQKNSTKLCYGTMLFVRHRGPTSKGRERRGGEGEGRGGERKKEGKGKSRKLSPLYITSG